MKRFLFPLLLVLLVLILFGDLVTLPGGQVVGGHDLVEMFIPWWQFALQSLRGGEIPLWNPYLSAGVPFLANPQPALFYPPVWLVLALAQTRAVTLLWMFHLWLAGMGMFLWLRSEEAGSFLGGVTFAFSGYFFARIYAGHIGVLMTQAWLPLILWATRRAVEGKRWTGAVLGGVPVALSLLAGHTASFYYVLLAQAAYALYLLLRREGWRDRLAGLGLLAVMDGVGLGLAAGQLLPALQFLAASTRSGAGYEFAASYTWPPGYLLTLFVPRFFGEPVQIGYWGDGMFEEMVLYAGLLPLLLTMALGLRLRDRRTVLLLGLAGAGLLLAVGPFTVLHRLAYNFLPLFRAGRAPARAGFLFTFAAAALGGLSLTRLRREPEESSSALLRWTRGPFPWAAGGLAVLVILAGFLLFALQRESNPEAGRLWHIANSTALFLLFFLLTTGLLHVWGAGDLSPRWGTILAVGLTLLDLWSFGRPLLRAVPLEESGYWRGVAELTEEGRVLPWGLGIFEQNGGLVLGVESVFGYDPLELDRHHRLTTFIPDHRARAYDLLHARYLVVGQEGDFGDGGDAPRLVGHRDGAWVYERPAVLPRAWIVHRVEARRGDAALARLNEPDFDPRSVALVEGEAGCRMGEPAGEESARVTRRTNNQVEVEISTSAPGLLVLSEVYYPGWQAAVDGVQSQVLPVDVALRGVCVPPGEHTLLLTFRPVSLRAGLVVSLLALFLAGWAVWREIAARSRGQACPPRK